MQKLSYYIKRAYRAAIGILAMLLLRALMLIDKDMFSNEDTEE